MGKRKHLFKRREPITNVNMPDTVKICGPYTCSLDLKLKSNLKSSSKKDQNTDSLYPFSSFFYLLWHSLNKALGC